MSTIFEYISTLSREDLLPIIGRIEHSLFAFDNVTQIQDNLYYVSNRIGKKKCIIIIMAANPEMLLNKMVLSAKHYITEPNFVDRIDCFCLSMIDERDKALYVERTLLENSIDLKLFDIANIASFKEDCLIDLIPKQFIANEPDEGGQKYIYEILCSGHDSTDIKLNLISSVIIITVYENSNSIKIEDLQDKTEQKLGKVIPNFPTILQKLGAKKRIVYDKINRSIVHLSEEESAIVKKIIEESRQLESNFKFSFIEILKKNSIEDQEACYDKLQELYKSHFEFDSSNEFEERSRSAFNDFKAFINKKTDSPNLTETVINQVKQLCERNPYLNRISASNSFVSLFKSDELEKYIRQKQNCIFLDTPVLVYLICSKSLSLKGNVAWPNSQCKSTRSLYDMSRKKDFGDVFLFTMNDYINEVYGELNKAFQLCWSEKIAPVDLLLKANNTFYNYYQHVKSHSEEIDVSVDSFEEFAQTILGITSDSFDSLKFESSTKSNIKRLVEKNYGIPIKQFSSKRFDLEEEMKFYESTLKRNKTRAASYNDTRTLLYLSTVKHLENTDNTKDVNLYLATWDSTFDEFHAHIMERSLINEFEISSPAKIVNNISMASFNIDASCITNDIFLYADKNFSITTHVKTFVNRITSLVGSRGTSNNQFFKSVFDWYNEQVLQSTKDFEVNDLSENHVEKFLLGLIDEIDKQLNSEEKEELSTNFEVEIVMTKKMNSIKDHFDNTTDILSLIQNSIDFLKDTIRKKTSSSTIERVFRIPENKS